MKTIATLLFTIFLPTFLAAQPHLTNDRLDVQQTIIKMFEALSDRDSVSLKSICSPDITLYEYGQVWSIDTLVTRGIAMNQSADFKRTNTFEFINTTADKATAWVTYRLISAITKDGKQKTVSWLETVILERDKKRWKVKHLHSTLLKSS